MSITVTLLYPEGSDFDMDYYSAFFAPEIV